MSADLLSEKINEIFQRVATDFRIFDINVTTDSLRYAATDPLRRMHIIITPTYEWYGSAGGVALVGSFGWGDDTPCWVFSTLLNNDSKYIAEAISHEMGHTLGLLHQSRFDTVCQKTLEYADGSGQGSEGWAPIMGVSYYRNVSTWTVGTSEQGCTSLQDDVQIISQRLSILADDHGDDARSCSSLPMQGASMQVSGMISSASDRDVFSFRVNKITRVILKVNPEAVASNNEGANLNVRLELFNAFNEKIREINDTSSLSAMIDTSLNAGVYYLVVQGAGNGNMSEYGSRGMYTVDATSISALPVQHVELTGKITGRNHQLQWSVAADEPLRQIALMHSMDGIVFKEIRRSGTPRDRYMYKPAQPGKHYYRLKVLTEAGSEHYSKIVMLQDRNQRKPVLMGNIVQTQVQILLQEATRYELIGASGQRLQAGAMTAGVNRIPIRFAYTGILYLRIANVDGYDNFTLFRR